MGLKLIDYKSKAYQQLIQLRLDILRKPLGLTLTDEDILNEKNDIFIGAFDEDELIGCCILTKIEEGTLRLRQMAVQKKLQGKGIGDSILSFAENIARDKGYKKIVMHARDSAIGFYEKFGYSVKSDLFTEVNLPHHIMEKSL